MNARGNGEGSVWADAVLAGLLVSIDPAGLGGVALRARVGPVRERWLATWRARLARDVPVRPVPLHVPDGRLLGGLDLTTTLRAGRPVAERGILSEANGGYIVLAMAERLTGAVVARVTAALDCGEVVIQRDGLALRLPAAFGVIALDEGAEPDERPPGGLLDRLAFHVDLEGVSVGDLGATNEDPIEITMVRARLKDVRIDDNVLEALTATAMTLGIASLRAVSLAARAATALAALNGRARADEHDAATAARLVFAARATRLPAPPLEDEPNDEHPEESEFDSAGDDPEDESRDTDRPLEDIVLAAAQAAIPVALLAQLGRRDGATGQSRAGGRAGAMQKARRRGRPAGTLRGEPRGGARLDLVETLRSAAPWQGLRRREAGRETVFARIDVRPEDFRVTRFKQRAQTTTIFVVDASGSSALNRLAEAKGAVELLLAECYVRRDQVALIAFRGPGAELLLPPTRSLVRAKRSLAALPGGGGTPLAAGIDAAVALADLVRRRGDTPTVLVFTDGRANVARGGKPGRADAESDALGAARQLRLAGLSAVLLDTSPRPHPEAERLAREMGARYMPLPRADAATLSVAIRTSVGE